MQLEMGLLSTNGVNMSIQHVIAAHEYMHRYRGVKIVQEITDEIKILHIKLQPPYELKMVSKDITG
jgi:hypothetical protein